MSIDERPDRSRSPVPVEERRRPQRNGTHVAIAGAAGTIAALAVRLGFSSHNVLVLGGIGYGTFLATMAVLGFGRAERPAPVRQEPAALRPCSPVAVPRAQFARDGDVLVASPAATLHDELPPIGPSSFEDSLPDDPFLDVPLRSRALSNDDFIDAAIALAAALTAVFVLKAVLAWGDLLGPALWGYGIFLCMLYVVSRDRVGPEVGFDRMVTFAIWTAGAIIVGLLSWMLLFLLAKGLPDIKASFFTQDMAKAGPLSPGGGAKAAIIGTFEQVGLATVIVVPLAILTAVYLHELKGRGAWVVRFIVDAMSGLPSIVAGLLVFTLWVGAHGFSGASGSVALIVLMLPTVTRTSEEILRTVPDPLREASLALGAPQWRVVIRVVLPTASAGLVTAVIFEMARAAGETAPMLLTSFGTDQTNTNPFKGPQSDLPTFVYGLIREPNKAQNNRAFAGLLVLVLLVIVLFSTARYISSRSQRKLRRAR